MKNSICDEERAKLLNLEIEPRGKGNKRTYNYFRESL